VANQANVGQGYYVLTIWANAGGANPPDVRSYFKNTYGEDTLANVGQATAGLNFASLEAAFKDEIDAGASPAQPTLADINSGLLKVGGELPSVFSTVKDVVSEDASAVASFSLTSLKVLAVVAIVGGIAYILYTTGAFRHVAAKAAKRG